jgi:hypothetical protein
LCVDGFSSARFFGILGLAAEERLFDRERPIKVRRFDRDTENARILSWPLSQLWHVGLKSIFLDSVDSPRLTSRSLLAQFQ